MKTKMRARPRVVFCRVGWMSFYSLWPEDEGPLGGGAYNDEGAGGEIHNFREFDRRYLGYVQAGTGGEAGLNLRRIDPSTARREDELEDVLVVLVAKRPNEAGQVVVGWYAGSTCHSSMTYWRSRPFAWSADPERAVLLPEAERTIAIPKGKGGMGQSNVAYAYDAEGEPHDGAWIDAAIESIANYTGPNLVRGAAYNELDEVDGHAEKKQREMLEHVIKFGVQLMWRGAEITRAALREPYDLVVRRGGQEERIILRTTEDTVAHVDLSAEVIQAVRASEVPYALLVVSSLAVRVRNGDFAFSGGVPHRESPFHPSDQRLTPVVLRYSWT